MAAYRCSMCGIEWPTAAVFSKTCPECGEPTHYGMTGEPMGAEEVANRCNEIEARKKREIGVAKSYETFEAFYVEREVVELYEDMDAFANIGSAPDQ